jgi:subtilisin family serine protease
MDGRKVLFSGVGRRLPVPSIEAKARRQEAKMATVNTSKLQLRIASAKGDPTRAPRVLDVIAKLRDRDKPVHGLAVSRKPGQGQIVTGTVLGHEIEDVRADENVVSLKAATGLHLCLHHSVPAIHCDPESLFLGSKNGTETFPGLDGSGVVIGIVDVGCDFRHKNFRHGNMTRIHRIWDQSTKSGVPPKGFEYGREITAEEINHALRHGDAGAYQALGYAPPIAAHGTHVMDIAAGNGREEALFGGKPSSPRPAEASHPGIAPNATMVFVQLKNDPDGFLGNSRQLLEAVEYVFQKADQLDMPAVVNLSIATSGGPHDGSTLVEQGFESLLAEKPGRAIVVSAGNSRLQRSHTTGTVSSGRPVNLRWYTDPGKAKNRMEVWYPGDPGLVVRLRTPDGVTLPQGIRLGETWDLHEDDREGAAWLGRISHRANDPDNGDHQIEVCLPHLDGRPWEIELSREANVESTGVSFHAWIDQEDLGVSRFEEPVESHTVNSIGCSRNLITVGAFDTSERESLRLPYEASAIGPTRNDVCKPDVSAPGVAIVAARAHGGVTVMSGTSMAAAHVTGLTALLFQLAQRAGRGRLRIEETRALLSRGNVDARNSMRSVFALEKKALAAQSIGGTGGW